ncbi:MAG: hypothetical protein SAK42_22825, partial [Oscillatoria sp. PMC 1076.18]|nr:hypothetical protein [Oscillatoria sp. PMC 1076.18]
SGYAVYLGVCFGLLISLLSINQVKKWQIITVFELFLVVVNSLMTGSRSVVFANILFLLGYLTIRIFSQPGSTLNLIQKLFIPGIAISIAAFIWFRPAIDAFWGRATTNTDLTERVGDSFSEPFKFTKYKNLDGYGTGAAHQATPVLRKALNLPRGEFIPTYFEGETGRIALELGPIGFCLWYFMKLVIAFNLLRLFFKLKRPFLRQLTLSAFLTHGIRINGLTVFHHTFSVYYWFLAGFIFLLPRLEKLACWQEYQQLQQLWQFYEQSSDLSSSPDE